MQPQVFISQPPKQRTTPTRVGCSCGWRGARQPRECQCYDENAMYCRCTWGSCPKCKGRVYPMWLLKVWRKDKTTD